VTVEITWNRCECGGEYVCIDLAKSIYQCTACAHVYPLEALVERIRVLKEQHGSFNDG
jgi:hypothetical protein